MRYGAPEKRRFDRATILGSAIYFLFSAKAIQRTVKL
jgi:hypothetical protein